jgi:hypothetical protein
MANYKVSRNVIERQNVNRQGQNVAAKKQLKFKYISNWNNNNNNNNAIIYYLYAESTATRPITDTAQCRYR